MEAFREFEPELGPGEFVTTFDRSTGHADLAYATDSVQVPVEGLAFFRKVCYNQKRSSRTGVESEMGRKAQ